MCVKNELGLRNVGLLYGKRFGWSQNFSLIITQHFSNIIHSSHTYLPMEMEQSVPKRRHMKFRRRRITQKKAYNIQNTAKVWNKEMFKKSAYTFCMTWYTKTKCCLFFCTYRCCLWLTTDGKITFSAVRLINPQCLRAVLLCFSLTHLSALLISHCLLICLQQYWRCSLWASWLLKLEEAIHYGRRCDIINYFNLYRSMELYDPNFN
jgi:hypothetical protein